MVLNYKKRLDIGGITQIAIIRKSMLVGEVQITIL